MLESFAALEPTDGFRNYLRAGHPLPAEYLLVDRANLLTLRAPEMTVLMGGLRASTQTSGVRARRLHHAPGDPHQRLLRQPARHGHQVAGVRRVGRVSKAATSPPASPSGRHSVDLVFGSNSELRALVEVYASSDAQPEFLRDFVAAWAKVMNLDRFDLRLTCGSPGRPRAPAGPDAVGPAASPPPGRRLNHRPRAGGMRLRCCLRITQFHRTELR